MNKQAGEARPQPTPGRGRRWVRRRIIINASFQFRMVTPIALFALVLGFLVGGFMFYPLQQNASQDPNPVVRALLSEQVTSLHVRFWPMLALAAIVVSLYTLVRSNRVAGPLYKLRHVLNMLAEGKYPSLRFRNGDELREFEETTNRLAKRLESLAAAHLRRMTTVERRLKWLRARLETQNVPRIEMASELDALLAEFSQVQILGSGS